MQWVIENKDGNNTMLPVKMLTPAQLKAVVSPLAWKILQLLVQKPDYPKGLGKRLKVHEQKIYYHIRRLEAAGLVKKLRTETKQGALANIYTIVEPAFAITLKELEPATKLFSMPQSYREYLEPFIKNGRLDALIVIGNPEPHGPDKAKGHDGLYATDLALFLGTFLNFVPSSSIKLDTDMREVDMKRNLILIGGPGVNAVTAKVNAKLPIHFVRVKYNHNYFTQLKSEVSGKTYSEESYAIICKTKNPWDKNKAILVIAGRRFFGTKAAVLAIMQHFDEVCKGNSYNPKVHARVIDGIDMDSDGEIDAVEFLE
ncbi:MAG: helix-turn-helix domain-containing protein [Candidatus Aenigmatarchaeota archaeon]